MTSIRILRNPDASAALDRIWIAAVRLRSRTVAAYGATPDDAKAALAHKLRQKDSDEND